MCNQYSFSKEAHRNAISGVEARGARVAVFGGKS
jgi:hypothetical protein